MIRINLLKKERRRVALPDLSKLKEIKVQDILKERGIFLLPLMGALIVGVEVYYVMEIRREIENLRGEIARLTLERNNLKKKADEVQAQKRKLQREINELRARIRYLEMSREIILTLKDYYVPFNESLRYLYTNVPSTVWLDNLSQTISFSDMSVELSLGSYDIDSIKHFIETAKKRYPEFIPGTVEKKENKIGIIYYTSSIKFRKDLAKGEE
jgi:predicted nuclease with TOPRIM domain